MRLLLTIWITWFLYNGHCCRNRIAENSTAIKDFDERPKANTRTHKPIFMFQRTWLIKIEKVNDLRSIIQTKFRAVCDERSAEWEEKRIVAYYCCETCNGKTVIQLEPIEVRALGLRGRWSCSGKCPNVRAETMNTLKLLIPTIHCNFDLISEWRVRCPQDRGRNRGL